MFCISAKPGVCPSENLGVGLCVEMCFDDGDCPNDEKCCGNGCGHHCMPPYKGIYIILVCGSACFVFLFFFQSLWFFCHGFCMSAEPEKPGLCPKNLEIALLGDCAERCSMTVTVQTMRNAAAKDVNISVCLHIEVFVIIGVGVSFFPLLQ